MRHHASLLRSLACVAAGLGASACGSAPRPEEKLPFHVAVVPPPAFADAARAPAEGNETELAFQIDQNRLLAQMEQSLGQVFTKVSRLAPAAGTATRTDAELVTQAQAQGADLVLRAALSYDPNIRTSTNDRFWLNLPLFALGGPFCWFVADRSYHCYTRLDGQLFDVAVAAGNPERAIESRARVLRVERESTEASLSFMQRADGAGAYLLSLVCPAGLLASEASAVPAELDGAVTEQLCQSLTKALKDRAVEITESDLVDFHPRGVRVVRDGSARALEGEMVLGLGQANELGSLRYRVNDGKFADAAWGAPTLRSGGNGGRERKVYPFRIALPAETKGTVQLEVEQLDRLATRRTFTFAMDG